MGLNLFGSSNKKSDNSTVNNDTSIDNSVGGDRIEGGIDNSDNSVTNITDGGAFELVGTAIETQGAGLARLLDSADYNIATMQDTVNSAFSAFNEFSYNNDQIMGETIAKSFDSIGSVASDLSESFRSENSRLAEGFMTTIVKGLTVITVGGALVYGFRAYKGKK